MANTTEDFIPSPSLDSHTMPMEVQIPLLESSSQQRDSAQNDSSTAIMSDSKKADQSYLLEKIPMNRASSLSQSMKQPISHEMKTAKLSDRLFAVGQLKTLAFYQALVSEFLGTMLLIFLSSSMSIPMASKHVPALNGALVTGLAVATIIVGFGHTSGAHINPAVTISFLITCEIDFLRSIFYIVVQLLGGSCGSLLLKFLVPARAQGNLGMTLIGKDVSNLQACAVEFIATFILCYTVHAICDKRRDDIGGSKALAVGLAVTIDCLFAGPFTGGSMNPARSFGPSLIMNSWNGHWVYWLGPISGAIISALVYTRLLKKQTTVSHVTNLDSVD